MRGEHFTGRMNFLHELMLLHWPLTEAVDHECMRVEVIRTKAVVFIREIDFAGKVNFVHKVMGRTLLQSSTSKSPVLAQGVSGVLARRQCCKQPRARQTLRVRAIYFGHLD